MNLVRETNHAIFSSKVKININITTLILGLVNECPQGTL